MVRIALVDKAPPAKPESAFIDTYLAYLLARASHRVSGQFHEALRARRVPVMHWRVMAALRDAPMSVSTLGQVILAQQPTVSKLLDRMTESGLIRRETATHDRRRVIVSLTARGVRAVDPLIALARTHERAVLAPFGEHNAGQLVAALRQLVEDPRDSALSTGRPSRRTDDGSPPSTARTDSRRQSRRAG